MLEMLLSLACIIPAVWLGYTVRAWWVARGEWQAFNSETKAFYLLVAPPLTLALDVFLLTDRLFYWPRASLALPARWRPANRALAIIAAVALVSDAAVAAEMNASAQSIPTLELDEPIARTSDSDARQPYLSPSEASSIQYREFQSEQRPPEHDTEHRN